jgi:CubicO group peptidase (beta-lactamase class C family)
MHDLMMHTARENELPRLAVTIFKNGRNAFDEKASAQPAHGVWPQRFRIASLSKPITAVAVFRLIERGALGLDTKVFGSGGILTDFDVTRADPRVQQITVDHLLSHTAGGWANDSRDPMFHDFGLDKRALIAKTLAERPLDHNPGDSYAYSNFGYCLLGRVIEQVVGRVTSVSSYEAHVRADMLSPCGIEDMRIAGNMLSDLQEDEARYQGAGDEPYEINVARMDSHGGWIASAIDMVNFIGHVDGSREPRLVSPESLRKMTQPSAQSTQAGEPYGRGWMINGSNWYHNGKLPGTATVMVRTESGLAWTILTNVNRPSDNNKLSTSDVIDRLGWDLVNMVTDWQT